MDSFANAPKSLGEVRSDRSKDSADWTPRDVLIAMLREIDSGTLEVSTLVCVFKIKSSDDPRVGFRMASPDMFEAMGTLELGKDRMLFESRG